MLTALVLVCVHSLVQGRAAVIRLALAVVVGPDGWDNVFLRSAEDMQALRDSGKLMFSQVCGCVLGTAVCGAALTARACVRAHP